MLLSDNFVKLREEITFIAGNCELLKNCDKYHTNCITPLYLKEGYPKNVSNRQTTKNTDSL